MRFQFVSRFTMAHVPVIPAGADVVAAVDPPVPAPVVPPVVIPAPVGEASQRRLCKPGASVRAPVGRPARRALRWDSYCSGTRKSGRRV